jgi:signal transduction histidine kinase/ligand-binding sensor domain-containing protein/DNA-binding response OmpR family regulator
LLACIAIASPAEAAESTNNPVRALASGNRDTNQYLFQTVGLEHGLPATSTLAAVQTRDGYLWVATPGGLARFDGVRFTVFRTSNTPAFRSHAIRCLCESRTGALWIGTDRGVIRYRDGVFEHIGLEQSSITTMAEDHTGTMWVGTYGQGLHSWAHGTWQHHERAGQLGSPFIRAVQVDADDRLWLGFERHAGVVCGEAGTFRFYDGGGRITDRVQAICEYPRGTLWFGTRNQGLFQLRDGGLRQFTTADGLASNEIAHLRPSIEGGLWIVGDGLQRVVDVETFHITTIRRTPDDRYNSICEDAEGSTWLCTPNDYLIRLRKRPYALIAAGEPSSAQQVRSVTQDASGNVWFLLYRRGAVRVAPDGTAQTIPPPAPSTHPHTIFAARDGTVWMVDNRLYAWRDGQWTVPFPSLDHAYTIFEDHTGRIWCTTEGLGVYRVENGELQRVTMDGSHNIPNTVASFSEGPDGTVYLGLWQEGLVRLRASGGTIFNHASGMPGNEVRAVYADADGRAWVGLKDHGLAVLEHDVWLYSAALSEVLADNVRAVIEDGNGRLWLATPLGVMSAPKDELLAVLRGERPVSSLHLASVDDLSHVTPIFSGAQPVAWKVSDNRMLFAGRDGVVVVDPTKLAMNTIAPPVHIERVQIDRRASLEREITASPGTRVITIDYTAPSFVRPDRVFFKYRLDGYDREWVDAGTRRTVSYTHLPPGIYTFRVKACNSDGVWNALGDRITLVQLPYFYQTWWFYALTLAAGLVSVVTLYKWRTMALRRENERLESGIADRTCELALANRVILDRTRELELASNAKSEFLETVSHEIRNPLHGLNGLLGLLKQESLGGAARELADSVQACARGLTRVFEEVLGYARLEHGSIPAQITMFSLRECLADLVTSFAWHAQQQGNRITLVFSTDFVDGFEGDIGKLKTIASNFLGNAIKYAPGRPIELNVEQHARSNGIDEIHIEVCDHGPGIPASEQELIFKKFVRGSAAQSERVAGTGLGLATCRILAGALQGHIGVESTVGEGATFYLCVPLKRATLPPPESIEVGVASPPAGTMLIVDDERYNQLVLRGAALELDYECEVVGTAEQALARITERAFDVVLLDWELPGTKGDEVARQIRARPDGGIPIIIATTAHDGEATRRACLESGMDEFLAKPYHAGEVRGCIARARQQRIAPTAAISRARPPTSSANHGLNLAAFELHARGSAAAPRESAEAFVVNLRALVARLEEAVARDDTADIDEAAHSLRGLGGLVGAQALCAAMREFEHCVRQDARGDHRAALRTVVVATIALEREILVSAAAIPNRL